MCKQGGHPYKWKNSRQFLVVGKVIGCVQITRLVLLTDNGYSCSAEALVENMVFCNTSLIRLAM